MSERSTWLLLDEITTAIDRIETYVAGLDFKGYEDDQKTKHAVERNFTIIGEAVRRVPEAFWRQHGEVEWRILKDSRNFLIYDYPGINDAIVWNAITAHLSPLRKQIEALKPFAPDDD